MIKLKITEGHPNLISKTLELTEINEMLYKCENTGFEVVDTENEIDLMIKYNKEHNHTEFFDLHLFIQTDKELWFISEALLLKAI